MSTTTPDPIERHELLDIGPRVVLRPVPAMKPDQLITCSVSLMIAGLLLTRGFIGLNPARPVFVVLGAVLAVCATAGLAVDHVAVRSTREHPDDVMAAELQRSRRYGHAVALVAIDCDRHTVERLVTRLRGSDRAWRQRAGVCLLLAETDRSGAEGFVLRNRDLMGGRAARVASFPEDALTVEGLHGSLTPLGGPAVVRPMVEDR